MKFIYVFGVCIIYVFIFVFGCAEGRNRWSGLSEGPFNVDTLLDGFLVEVNRHIRKGGMTAYKLNDFSIANATGKGVVLSEMDTLIRTGPASIANVGTVFLANVTLGLKSCYINVGSLIYSGTTAPVIFSVKENSIQAAYSVDLVNKTNCTLTWNIFQLLKFDKVTTISPEPSFNNSDVSELFKTTVMEALNNHFASVEFLDYMDIYVNPCRHRSSSNDPVAQLRRLIYVYK